MATEYPYDVEICRQLTAGFDRLKLHRPRRQNRYDAGDRLIYQVTGVDNPGKARLQLEIEKFVGGGFAGQVYKVKVLDIETGEGPDTRAPHTVPLQKGGIYAMKILIPTSGFSRFFRNLVYRIGFQGPFQPQVNPAASRVGALWQKFIRRGAKIRFGTEQVVNNIHATFIDHALASCGEISDWVEGRTWTLEVDEHMDLLKRFKRGKPVDKAKLGSPEYRAKKKFMADFVKLLYDMGAYEFARQYEWSTAKSQPNCLKLKNTDDDPGAGLVAVDFRAGLALLPFLPMSPGDVRLIFKGMARGSLVQFDRGSLEKLERFVRAHPREFSDMQHMLAELKECEQVYRHSVPDITHHHFRLLYSRKLWSTMLQSFRTGWGIRNLIDDKVENKLGKSNILTLAFCSLGIIPLLGSFLRKLWGRADWRRHYKSMLTDWDYFKRTIRGKYTEKAMAWYRSGRLTDKGAQKMVDSSWRYLAHLPLSLLPVGLHRFFSQWSYFKERLYYLFIRPLKLYFSAAEREQWLQDMVTRGQEKQMLSRLDAGVIRSQIKEPFIQKYLKSLAVHVCTLPVTQVVSLLVSWLYVTTHPALSTAEAAAAVAAILVLFQITPISPGSLVRGFYVVYLVIKERNFKDYRIALSLSFFKYIGYLAFPIQMTHRYPALARFMASHWATEAVHIVPVFGESGALLEHWVFCLFYNWPLTIRRRMRSRARTRALHKPRYWHVPLFALVGSLVPGGMDYFYLHHTGALPGIKEVWWLAVLMPMMFGSLVTLGCRGAALSRRIISAALGSILLALFHTGASAALLSLYQMPLVISKLAVMGSWRLFIFTVLSTAAAVLTEMRLPEPQVD